MSLEKKHSSLRNITKITSKLACALWALQLMSLSTANAVEVLGAKELASHCDKLSTQSDGIDGQYCIRYIQGFIDGAIATDARVMLNAEEAMSGKETFAERALRTRMPGRAALNRAAQLAGFCLGDPLPIQDVVKVVVSDLTSFQDSEEKDQPAMEVVYNSLLKNYPCTL
jgi:hypothetical protein